MTPEEKTMHEQAALHRKQELLDYIDALFIRLKTLDKNNDAAFGAVGILLLLQVGALFTGIPALMTITSAIFWFGYVASMVFYRTPTYEALAEIDGCFRTLEILGFIDPIDRDRRKGVKKRRESVIAKVWEQMKRLTQGKAYGTA